MRRFMARHPELKQYQSRRHREAPPSNRDNASVRIGGPVIRQDGSINADNLKSLIAGIQDAIGTIDPSDHPVLLQLRQDLNTELECISTTCAQTPLELEHHLQLRNTCKRAAGVAKKLADLHYERDTRLSYSCLASLLVQMKRTFLTNAAPLIADDWATRQLGKMESAVPTIDYMSRSSISKDKSFGVAFQAGPADIGITVLGNRTYWFDDDRDANFWNSLGLAVKVGSLPEWILSLAGEAGIEAGSKYFETESMKDIILLVLNHDANRAWRSSADKRKDAPGGKMKRLGNRIAGGLFGKELIDEPEAPTYLNDKKLAKGFNLTHLHLHAAAIDYIAGETRLGTLFKTAFPTAGERLRGAVGQGDYREPLGATVPLSDPLGYGRAPYRNYRITVSLGKDIVSHELDAGVSADADWSVSAGWNTAQFHLQNVEPSHRLLDPDYHADMPGTFELVRQLDARSGTDSRLHLYGRIKQALGANASISFNDAERDYYGEENSVPGQFHELLAIRDPDELVRRIRSIAERCRELKSAYEYFVDLAATVAAKPDDYAVKASLPKLEQSRHAAFREIDTAIWGKQQQPASDENIVAGYPGGSKEALRHPERFAAASHDAIGLSLALTGIHLSIAKRQLAFLSAECPDEEAAGMKAAVLQADRAYADAKSRMSGAYLPMKKESVFLKQGTFSDRGLSQRHNFILKGTVRTGFFLNMFESIAHRFGKSIGDVSISNEAGQLALSARCRYQFADNQINPSRQGHFLEFKFTALGGAPVTGELIARGIVSLMRKLYPDMDLNGAKAGLLEQLRGVIWDSTAGAGITIRLRKFPGAAGRFLNGFRMQFIQLHQERTAGPVLGIPIPTPWGRFKLKWSKQNTFQNVVFESIGPELGYLMLQHKKLERVLKAARETPHEDENHALAHLLKGEAKWVADSYFSNKTLITKTIDEYMEYHAAAEQAKTEDRSLKDAPAHNEFYRYYERDTEAEPFHRVARIAREVKHFAPGSSAAGAGDPFHAPVPLLTGVTGLPSPEEWDAAKTLIAGLEDKNARIDYYCGDGRWVLDLFARIVENTRTIHNLSRHRVTKTRYGFRTTLNSAKPRSSA